MRTRRTADTRTHTAYGAARRQKVHCRPGQDPPGRAPRLRLAAGAPTDSHHQLGGRVPIVVAAHTHPQNIPSTLQLPAMPSLDVTCAAFFPR